MSEKVAAQPQKPKQTNIDRRQCKRVVPMKVLCLGQPRTGTMSLFTALKQLGYDDVYHYLSCMENPKDGEMWAEAFQAKYEGKGTFGKDQWDQLLGHCQAVTDGPPAYFYAELLAAYPDAKVILTTRPVDAWHTSMMKTIYRAGTFMVFPTHNPLILLQRLLIPHSPLFALNKPMFKYCVGADFPEAGKQRFHDHNEGVRRAVREQGRDMLEFEVKQGWGPLCKHLGHEVPSSEFPRVNDAEAFADRLKMVLGGMRKAAAMRAGGLITGIVLLALAYRRLWLKL